jgi:hypothetical protein
MSRYRPDRLSSKVILIRRNALDERAEANEKKGMMEKGMMAANYYVHKSVDEGEGVGRWENEGGRLGQRHDLNLDSIGEAMLSLASDGAKDFTGQTPFADGGRSLPATVSAV